MQQGAFDECTLRLGCIKCSRQQVALAMSALGAWTASAMPRVRLASVLSSFFAVVLY